MAPSPLTAATDRPSVEAMAIRTKRWTRLARAGVADYWIVDLVD
jgi:hypothetical protein